MLAALLAILHGVVAIFRSRRDRTVENLALRQQLAIYKRTVRRPKLTASDRLFWTTLSRLWHGCRDALVIVKPETVIARHRRGFRRYWSWLSRRGRRGATSSASAEVRELVRRIALDRPTWGAPRVHGEIRMLGFNVSERTVSRWLRRFRRRPQARQNWFTFLRNHRDAIAATDFFVVFSAAFRPIYVWFAIEHARRRVLHVNVTEHPTSAWAIQNLREAFPFDSAPKYLIFDRDSIFSAEVAGAVKTMGIDPIRTAFASPWQNPVAERFVGTCRRDLLDHVVVLDQRHLLRLLREYVGTYYLPGRTHLGVGKDTPAGRPVEPRPSPTAKVVALPRCGGLHHRYVRREAA